MAVACPQQVNMISSHPGTDHSSRFSGSSLLRFSPTFLQSKFDVSIPDGEYLGLYSYRLITWRILRLNQKENQPGVNYLHPWEIDPQHPPIRANALSLIRQYLNLGGTEEKLIHLLNDFRFGTVLEALSHQGLVKTHP
jgi:hypothetical protein